MLDTVSLLWTKKSVCRHKAGQFRHSGPSDIFHDHLDTLRVTCLHPLSLPYGGPTLEMQCNRCTMTRAVAVVLTFKSFYWSPMMFLLCIYQ